MSWVFNCIPNVVDHKMKLNKQIKADLNIKINPIKDIY